MPEVSERLFRCIRELAAVAELSESTRSDTLDAALLLRGLNRAGIEALLNDLARHLADPSMTEDAHTARTVVPVTTPQPQAPSTSETRQDESRARSAILPRTPGDMRSAAQAWLEKALFPQREAARRAPGPAAISLPTPVHPESKSPERRIPMSSAPGETRIATQSNPRTPSPGIAPLGTARWDSGRRTRFAGVAGVDPAPAASASPAAALSNPARVSDPVGSGQHRAAATQQRREAPASAPGEWTPGSPNPPASPDLYPRVVGAPLSRPWALLSRFDRASRPSPPSARSTPSQAGRSTRH